ncbi:MAG: hypothetical protein KME26_30335 [Oscillatoria princeps RMCB-10]|nr:hypothetical protein [Oscillatoria princeps RMCB-10]
MPLTARCRHQEIAQMLCHRCRFYPFGMAAPALLPPAGEPVMATFREPVGKWLRLRICAGVSSCSGRGQFLLNSRRLDIHARQTFAGAEWG